MTRFNTGNPLDSADPRDLSDNAKNLDQAINSESTTFTDRLGNERVTLAGGVDPTGFAQSALNDANRAEAAANAAFVNADVYDDVADGLASGDEQFQVVEGDEVVRYRRIDAENADEVARYPAAELVNIAMDIASRPASVGGEFHVTDESPEFAYAITDEEGRPLYASDENGQPITPLAGEFHVEDGDFSYVRIDKNGLIFYALNAEGESVIGSGLIGDIKDNKLQLQPGRAWADGSFLRIQRPLDWPYSSNLDEFHNRDVNILYGFYDNLVEEFPEYVSREEEGEDGLGNKIYSYRFRPKELVVTGDLSSEPKQPEYPKIVVVCGTHAGTERRQMWAGYIFAHDLCYNWKKDAKLELIRWGCDFIIIPCLVPSALATASRRNHNGVDINRNFPQDWEDAISIDPESQMYKGPSAASELETQALLSFMEKHQDAVAGVDFHGFGTGGSNPDMPIFWVGASLNSTIGVAQKTILEMNGYIRKNLEFLENLTDSEQSGRISSNAKGSVAYQFQIADGIDFVLLETHLGNWGSPFTRNQFHVDALTKIVHKFYAREMIKRLDFYSIYEES